MVNYSKVNDQRFRNRWESAGAMADINTTYGGKVTAAEIIHNTGMSIYPKHYQGKTILSDLDQNKLSTIYHQIKTHHNKRRAGNFVQMVADIPVLREESFLSTLYKLEENDWQWEKGLLEEKLRKIPGFLIRKNGHNFEVRKEFLNKHGIEI